MFQRLSDSKIAQLKRQYQDNVLYQVCRKGINQIASEYDDLRAEEIWSKAFSIIEELKQSNDRYNDVDNLKSELELSFLYFDDNTKRTKEQAQRSAFLVLFALISMLIVAAKNYNDNPHKELIALISAQIKDYPLCKRLFFLVRQKEIELEKRGKIVLFEDILGNDSNGEPQNLQPVLQEVIKTTLAVCQPYQNKTYRENFLTEIWQQLWDNPKTKLSTLLNSQSKYKVFCITIGRLIDCQILLKENNTKLNYVTIADELSKTDLFKDFEYEAATLARYMGYAKKDFSKIKKPKSDTEKYIEIIRTIVQ